MAIDVKGAEDMEMYLRVRFYHKDGTWNPIQAVYCQDFFAEEIAAELKYAINDEYDPNNGWYTKTFVQDSYGWVKSLCPNTTNLELQAAES